MFANKLRLVSSSKVSRVGKLSPIWPCWKRQFGIRDVWRADLWCGQPPRTNLRDISRETVITRADTGVLPGEHHRQNGGQRSDGVTDRGQVRCLLMASILAGKAGAIGAGAIEIIVFALEFSNLT